MSYNEFRDLMQANGMDKNWFFSQGWALIEQYPQWADRFVAEQMKEAAE